MTTTPFFGAILGSLLYSTFAIAGEPIPVESDRPRAESAPPSRFTLSGWIEAGVTANFAAPDGRQNFGRLLDDRSNEPLLNQLAVVAERSLDPKISDRFDWGFKVELFYGSDARYLKSTGLFDLTTNDIVQPDLPEAWLVAHFPVAGTSGGLDLKAGKFMNCFGAQMSDPRANVFYSHSYIFNFGCPFYGTGALATLHAAPGLDLYASVDRGLNVAVEDNNDSASFYGGVGGSLGQGKITYAALTHIGPENPGDNHNYRYLSDLTVSWKVTGRFTSITDLNYVYEESSKAKGYGIAQYVTYAINDWLTAGLRGEIWRDANGFFVAQFASNNDFLHFARGDDTVFDPRTVGGGRTTYGAVTLGVTIKPRVAKPLAGLMIRPELRYDRTLAGSRPFNDSSDRGMLTAGIDLILSF
ncbi:MAG: outer membrane beta-barrel protein [Spartobacteria bacterium]